MVGFLILGDAMIKSGNELGQKQSFGLPIISIYILGHPLDNLTEPVIYIRRYYQSYDDEPLPSPDPLIGSLTHDSIIVQIPFPDFITFCIIFFRSALQVSVEAILCSVWVTQRKILSSYHVCAKEKEPVRFDQCCSFR